MQPYLHHLSHELDQDQNEAGPSRGDTLRDQMDSLKVQQEDDTILEHSKLYKEIEEFCRLILGKSKFLKVWLILNHVLMLN